jgi:hypothetical protein
MKSEQHGEQGICLDASSLFCLTVIKHPYIKHTKNNFNPLKPKRERERRESGGGVAIGTTFNGRGEHKFTFAATKVPR